MASHLPLCILYQHTSNGTNQQLHFLLLFCLFPVFVPQRVTCADTFLYNNWLFYCPAQTLNNCTMNLESTSVYIKCVIMAFSYNIQPVWSSVEERCLAQKQRFPYSENWIPILHLLFVFVYLVNTSYPPWHDYNVLEGAISLGVRVRREGSMLLNI